MWQSRHRFAGTLALPFLLLAIPTQALAHAGDRAHIMILPTGYYLVGGALAVAASFILLALVPPGPLDRWVSARARLFASPEWLRLPASTLTFLFVLFLIFVGFAGSRDPLSNPLPLIVWTVFWVGGAIYVIYYLTQRNKARAAGMPTSPSQSQSGAGQSGAGWSAAQAGSSTPAATGSTAGAGYGAAGADWSAPAPPSGATPPYGGYSQLPATTPAHAPKPANPGPGTPAVAVTAGLALLAGGGIKALDAAHAINLGTAANAVVWASAAAVLGLGILVSGLRGRTAGILGFFAVVSLIIGGIFNLAPNADRARFQNIDWAPASIEQAQDGFDITGGTGTVDLTKLNLTPPLGSDVVVRLEATASNVTVVIPTSVPVQVQADMTMANLNDSRGNHSGVTTQQNDYNTDKPGSRLIIKISGTLSNITVREGN